MRTSLLLMTIAAALAACGKDDATDLRDTAAPSDTSPADTTPVDTTPADTAAPDDTSPTDTAAPDDTSPRDIPILPAPTDPPLPPGTELPIEVVRTFDCVPEGVGAELIVTEVLGDPGAVVLIRPDAAAECQYNLFHRAADGRETRISERASGYLFAAALRTASGTTLVCANAIVHKTDTSEDRPRGRYVDAVHIACAASTRDTFSPLTPIVVPDGAWAAWLRTLAERDDAPGTFSLRYARDFTYQFFNLSDAGRPSTDGLYEINLRLDGRGAVTPVAGSPALVDTRTNPLAELPVEPWNPTPAEQGELEHIIDFSNGPCADGCPP